MHHEHDDLCKKSNCVNRFVLFLRRILRVVNKALVDFFVKNDDEWPPCHPNTRSLDWINQHNNQGLDS